MRKSDGTVVTAVNSSYPRNGMINLFAALDVVSGSMKGKTAKSKKREDFLSFMDEVVGGEGTALSEGMKLHVILDNYCTNKPCTEWLARNPNVHFHYTPTSESCPKMVEIWFNIMSKKVL